MSGVQGDQAGLVEGRGGGDESVGQADPWAGP